MKKLMFVSMLVVILSGCVSKPSATEISNAEYGTLPPDYQQQIINYVSASLKDPDSGKFQFGTPYKGYIQDGLIYGSKVHYGYLVPAEVNAKNSYGGYVGFKPKLFIFSEGKLYDASFVAGQGSE